MDTMRQRFYQVTSALLDRDPRLAVVLADIGAAEFGEAGRRHPDRVINLGIREQLLISVAGGLALAGLRPVAHTFAPFLVERPFEQVKLDLGHQEADAVLVSAGGSYDEPAYGLTHLAPGDVALLDTLPGWTVHVPGHPDEAEQLLRTAIAGTGKVYLRLSRQANGRALAGPGPGFTVLRRGSGSGGPGGGIVIAVGPVADDVLAATAGLDVTVLYAATIRPFDRAGLRAALGGPGAPGSKAVVVVEPYLAGTSSGQVTEALSDVPHRVLGLGVARAELRKFGTMAEHVAAQGLDPAGLRPRIAGFLGLS
jgi:transketolase